MDDVISIQAALQARSASGQQLAPNRAFDVYALKRSFEQATGWTLESAPAASGRQPAIQRAPQAKVCIDRHRAQGLATEIEALMGQLDQTYSTIGRREAELAAQAPVRRRSDEESHLASRLKAILKAGAEAVDCSAAALYTLTQDDAHLKLRSLWGLPKGRLLDDGRELRHSWADLEALTGHAVVLENAHEAPHWNAPESFPVAACVPVSSPTAPLGTLWAFSKRPRKFTDQQTNVLELTAGRVAAELQREVLLAHGEAADRRARYWSAAAALQQSRLPRTVVWGEQWEVAGCVWRRDELDACVDEHFYDWMPHDQSLDLAVGGGHGGPLEAALTSSALHATLRATSRRGGSVKGAVRRMNRHLWRGSTGGQLGSLSYAKIFPQEATVRNVAAGDAVATMIGAERARMAFCHTPKLGDDDDLPLRSRSFPMEHGETLILTVGSPADESALWRRIAKSLRSDAGDEARLIAERIHGLLGGASRTGGAALVVRRK